MRTDSGLGLGFGSGMVAIVDDDEAAEGSVVVVDITELGFK